MKWGNIKRIGYGFAENIIFVAHLTSDMNSLGEITGTMHRGVAQLVARYVRDLEVGRSNRLTPTKKGDNLLVITSFLYQMRKLLVLWYD